MNVFRQAGRVGEHSLVAVEKVLVNVGDILAERVQAINGMVEFT